jgi:hypothetical protein
MEMYPISQQVLGVLLALSTLFALQSCATKTVNLVSEGTITVETVPSIYGHVSRVSVVASETGIRVAGEVYGSSYQRGYIRGHVDVEVIYPDGTVQEETVRYPYHGGKSRATPFSVDLPIEMPEGSTIRVIHNATSISDNR